ncbi:MAG TPA: sodium:calcium antiporter [Firmicutes bacterium]|jgi:cation:H+ antiporter|nr:sodium:calcium antiporter [Bacillota bacterium]
MSWRKLGIILNIWLIFLIDTVMIVVAGTQLAKNAEKISTGLGLSSAWAGIFLLSVSTSLPELVVTSRAVLINAPDLAGGNIYGSVIFNLTIIALIDLLQGRGPLKARRKRSLILTALLSITIIIFSMFGILLALPYRVGWVGVDSIALVLVYFLGSGMITKLERKKIHVEPGTENEDTADKDRLKKKHRREMLYSLGIFAAASVVILLAGTSLTDTVDRISLETGLSSTLAGSLFAGVVTSLPELVSSVAAVRLGFVDMAIANVLGSNFFNILLLFFADLFYVKGLLFTNLSSQNLIVALMSILLTIVVLLSFIYPLRRDFLRMGLSSYIIIIGYLFTIILLFYN